MKYFVDKINDNNREYFMFCMGYFDCDYTHKSNDIFLYADKNKELKFPLLFASYHDEYPYMDFLEINKEEWGKIKNKAKDIGDETYDAILELDVWVQKTFAIHDVFAIVGLE